MLEDVIRVGAKRGDDYQVRARLSDLIEDNSVLGGHLWEAFRQGETWPLTNLQLWPILAEASCSPDDIKRFLHHQQCPPIDDGEWRENKDVDKRQMYWSESLFDLISGFVRHNEDKVEALVASLDDFDEEIRWRLTCLLALHGAVPADALDESYLERFAVTWWLDQKMRRDFDFCFKEKDGKEKGVTLIWPEEVWNRTLCNIVLTPGFPTPSFGGFFWEFAFVFREATPEEIIQIACKIDELGKLDEHLARIIFENNDAQSLAPAIQDFADDILGRLDEASEIHVQIAAGLCCKLALELERDLDERCDPLVKKAIIACYGRRDGHSDIPDSSPSPYGCIIREYLEVVPMERREALVLLEKPPWYFCKACPTERVMRAIFEEGILTSTGRLESTWFLGKLLEHFGEPMARIAVEHLDNNFTRRPFVLEWLAKGTYDFALPAMMSLLSADAKTRKLVGELVKNWGESVLPHLPPLLSAKAKKTRLEAVKLLSSFASHHEAQKLAKESLENESDAAIKALMEPIAAQYSEASEDSGKGTGAGWGRDAFFQLEEALKQEEGAKELLELGASVFVPMFVDWLQQKQGEDCKRLYWQSFGYGEPSIETLRNIQLLFVTRAQQLAGQATPVEEKVWMEHAYLLFTEGGWRSLRELGAGVLDWVVQWTKRDAFRRSDTRYYYHDAMGEKLWDGLTSSFRSLSYRTDSEERKEALTKADEKLELAFVHTDQRRALLEEVLALVSPCETDGTFEPKEILASFERARRGEEPYYELRDTYEHALLPVLARWLLDADEKGTFDGESWRTDAISVDAWQNLCELVLFFQGEQPDTDEIDFYDFNKRDQWKEHVDSCGPLLPFFYKKLGTYTEQQVRERWRYSAFGQLDDQAWRHLEALFPLFAEEVDLLKPLETIALIIGQRDCDSDGSSHRALGLLSLVLDDPAVADKEKVALVERLFSAYQTFEPKARLAFLRWLPSRCAPEHPESESALRLLVEALGDKKKQVREEARALLIKLGSSVLESIYPLLLSKKITLRREAATIVSALPHPESVPFIDEALKKEKKAEIESELQQARLKSLPLGDIEPMKDKALDEALEERCKHLPSIPYFAQPSSLTACVWQKSKKPLSEKAMRWLISQCMRETSAANHHDLYAVFGRITQQSLDELCRALDQGASQANYSRVEESWLEHMLLNAASDDYLESLRERFYGLAKECKEAAFRLIDIYRKKATDGMIYGLIDWMQYAKRVETQRRCRWALSSIAALRQWTMDTLLEHFTPTFGFDKKGSRPFSEAGKGWRCTLAPSGQLMLHNAKNESFHQLPAPTDGDEEARTKFELAAGVFAQLREEIDKQMTLRHVRLEEAMLSQRTWEYKSWKALYLEHPILRTLSLGVVFVDLASSTSFVVTTDAKLLNAKGKAHKPKTKSLIKVAHVTDLSEEEHHYWSDFLREQGWSSPFSQLTRKAYHFEQPEEAFALFLRDMEPLGSGKELRKQLYRLGYKPEHSEGIVFQSYKSTVGCQVTLEHDAYSLHDPSDYEELDLRKLQVTCRDGNVPALVWSELMRELVLLERTLPR